MDLLRKYLLLFEKYLEVGEIKDVLKEVYPLESKTDGFIVYPQQCCVCGRWICCHSKKNRWKYLSDSVLQILGPGFLNIGVKAPMRT